MRRDAVPRETPHAPGGRATVLRDVVLAWLLVVAAGCGGGSEPAPEPAPSATPTPSAAAPTPTPAETEAGAGDDEALGEPPAELAAIRKVTRAYVAASRRGDGAAMCALLSEEGRASIVESGDAGGCAASAKAVSQALPLEGSGDVEPVSVDETSALVSDPESSSLFALTREGGTWKVDTGS